MGFLGNLVGVLGLGFRLCDITAGLMSLLMAKKPAATFDNINEFFCANPGQIPQKGSFYGSLK